MSVSAKFIADFSPFQTAVDNSIVTLKDWQKSIGNVDKDLTKMATAFSGQKVLQEATLAAKAVESIGGASKLTAKEQASLNALVTEAIAKYAALGQEAPAQLKKLQQETEKQESILTRIKNQLGPLGTALAGAFTVTAITATATKVFEMADHLENLSSKTGISTTGLQKLDLAFQSSGVSLDTVTANVTKLAKNLIGGDKTAVEAMDKLGLSVTNLKTLAPEEQFVKVADAVGQIQNPTERAYAAMAIFGKGGAELLQGLDGHLQETTDKFESMGLIIDEQTVKAADDFGDQMGLIGKQLLGILANAIGPMLPALSALATGFAAVASVVGPVLGIAIKGVTIGLAGLWENIANFLASLGDLAQKVPLVGKHLTGLADASDWLRKSAAGAGDMMVHLIEGTDKTATSAKAAVAPLTGFGDAAQKAGKHSEEAAAEVSALQQAFDASARAVQLFYAVVGQDEALQQAKKHVAEFVLPFHDLETIDQSKIKNLIDLAGGLKGELNDATAVAKKAPGVFGSMFDGIQGGFKNLVKGMTGDNGVAGFMNHLGKGIVDGFGQILSGGLASVISMGVQLAVAGIEKIGKLIGGLFQSEETKKVNKPRDQFFEQFGGYEGLASQLTDTLVGQGVSEAGNVAHDLITALNDAKTESNFHSAEESILQVFGASGLNFKKMAAGGMGRVTRPTLFLAGEKPGGEDYAFSGVGRSFGGGDTDRRLSNIERLLRDWPRANAIAMRAAIAGV